MPDDYELTTFGGYVTVPVGQANARFYYEVPPDEEWDLEAAEASADATAAAVHTIEVLPVNRTTRFIPSASEYGGATVTRLAAVWTLLYQTMAAAGQKAIWEANTPKKLKAGDKVRIGTFSVAAGEVVRHAVTVRVRKVM